MILSRCSGPAYRAVGPGFRVFRPVNYATDSGVDGSPAHIGHVNGNKQGAALGGSCRGRHQPRGAQGSRREAVGSLE